MNLSMHLLKAQESLSSKIVNSERAREQDLISRGQNNSEIDAQFFLNGASATGIAGGLVDVQKVPLLTKHNRSLVIENSRFPPFNDNMSMTIKDEFSAMK